MTTMASGDDRAVRPLAALFERARAASTAALEGGSTGSSSSSADDALDLAIAACSAAESAADAAGASPSASKNAGRGGGETADDLSARDLRWVLVPGWGGLLRSKRASSSSSSSSSSSLAAKRSALLEASERLKGFLSTCQELGVAPKEALATLKEADDGEEDEDEEEEEENGTRRRPPPPLSVGASNPEARRAAKIAAFRAKRELQAKLTQLREKAEKKKKKKKIGVAAASKEGTNGKDDDDGEVDDDETDDDDDDEELREDVLAEIALTCLSAADEVLAIKEEATMLRHALRRERDAEARGGSGGGSGGASGGGASAAAREKEEEEERKRREEAAAVATALRGAFSALSTGEKGGGRGGARPTFAPASVGAASAPALGGLFGPGPGVGVGGITGIGSSSAFDRGAAAASVVRPSHLLPTMSVEEFAAREVAEARARSEADRARKAAAAAAAAAARNSSADDGGDDGRTEADGGPMLDRLRALDDWKDDHPYGYGNSKRRPAATGSK